MDIIAERIYLEQQFQKLAKRLKLIKINNGLNIDLINEYYKLQSYTKKFNSNSKSVQNNTLFGDSFFQSSSTLQKYEKQQLTETNFENLESKISEKPEEENLKEENSNNHQNEWTIQEISSLMFSLKELNKNKHKIKKQQITEFIEFQFYQQIQQNTNKTSEEIKKKIQQDLETILRQEETKKIQAQNCYIKIN